MRLTDQQREVWLASQMSPAASCSYNWPLVLDVRGPLDVRTLATALQVLVDRHDALRASFPSATEPRIAAHVPIDLAVLDFSHYDPDARGAAAERSMATDVRTPFDLAQAPLARCRALRLDHDHHQVVITMHHIIADGWAGRVLTRELGALYASLRRGRAAALEPAPRLADYQRRQELRERSAAFAAARAHWAGRFRDGFSRFEMPTDRPRPPQRSYDGGRIRVPLPSGLARSIRRLSVERSCTLFMTLLAAFEAFAFRLTGRPDIVLGTPFANRDLPDDEDLVVHCANLLPLRAPDLGQDARFDDLLSGVREELLTAYEHGAYPLLRLAEDLNLPRDPRHLGFISTVFNIEQVRSGLDFGEELEVRATIPPSVRGATFDFIASIVQDGQALALDVIYNRSLYEDATIRRWASQYQTLLAGVVAGPDRRLSELPLLTEAERRQVVAEWNATTKTYPRQRAVHELFEEQAATRPAAAAVRCGGEALTYGELNARASRLGHWLRQLGVGPESLVGVCMERSVDVVVGLLGILKAGGAYLPLDPAYPPQRLQWMVDDARLAALVAQERLLPRLPAVPAAVVCLDRDWSRVARQPAGNLERRALPDNLAYVTYTSGSTGRPKGVMVTHRNVLRLLCGTDYVRFGPARTFLAVAPLAFDASTFELWGPLLHGGTCVLSPQTVLTYQELARAIHDTGADTMFLTARLFDSIVDHAPKTLAGLRELLVGGEALSPDHTRRALELCPDTALSNAYGPTEATTFAACYRLPPELPAALRSVPIGRPIANTRAYVLDSRLQPAPVGVPGELYLGGDGVSRGYLGRPGLTAERFVPDPLGGPGARLYRTGDAVRWLPDGQLEFLGRLDFQVKLRGFRVEPGEIEAALRSHGGVREAAATVRDDLPGGRCLVAYAVPAEQGVSSPELLAYLKARLPAYMIPSAVLLLDELPVLANGKTDWSALPRPATAQEPEPEVEPDEAAAPAPAGLSQATVEQAIGRIFAEVLGVQRVELHEDFFKLGGDSLLATQAVARVLEELDVELALPSLFEAPTVAGLTLVVLEAAGEQSGQFGWEMEELTAWPSEER